MTVLGVGGLLPIYLVARVGVSTFLMGALLTINPICQVVFMYVLGRVSDIMGRKPLIVGGAFGSGLYAAVLSMATVPTSIVGRVAVVAIGFLLLAGGFSALMTGTIAFIGDIAPEERESELIGFRQTARGLGGAIGPSVLGAIATVMSYSVAFAVGSLLSFVAAAIVAYHLIESHPSAELDASQRFGNSRDKRMETHIVTQAAAQQTGDDGCPPPSVRHQTARGRVGSRLGL
ncbi:MFS transporter [Halocatena marina]|uniref:MFS transporter n=1 Tax=Halocatena marina TaxID=2934937 RepID=A0ABD5YI73_9EURY